MVGHINTMGGIHTAWPREWAAWVWPAILAQCGNKGCNNRETIAPVFLPGACGEQSKLGWVGAERGFLARGGDQGAAIIPSRPVSFGVSCARPSSPLLQKLEKYLYLLQVGAEGEGRGDETWWI